MKEIEPEPQRSTMKTNFRSRRAKRTGKSFNPSHLELNQAILEFQKRGGKIQQITPDDESMNAFIQGREDRAVDEFLLGESSNLKF